MTPRDIAPYRRAAVRAKWFAAAFAVVCAIFAVLTWAGEVGDAKAAPILGLMALGGVVVFLGNWCLIRFITPSP